MQLGKLKSNQGKQKKKKDGNWTMLFGELSKKLLRIFTGTEYSIFIALLNRFSQVPKGRFIITMKM